MNPDQIPLLVVEGKTDLHFFVHLLIRSDIFAHIHKTKLPENATWKQVQIQVRQPKRGDSDSGGKQKLLDDIQERLSKPVPRAIGFVLDADSPKFHGMGLKRSWQAVRDQLTRSDIRWNDALPVEFPSQGFRGELKDFGTRVGVWIMPDSLHDGTVENFIESLVTPDSPLWGHAEQSTDVAKDQYGALFADKDRKKAVMQAWLAWQITPGMRFADAFRTGVLNHDAPSAVQFVDWVRWLIEGSPANDDSSS